MNYQLLAVATAITIGALLLVQQLVRLLARRRERRAVSARVHSVNDGRYAFLVNRNLEVEDTNYYELNPGRRREPPFMLGNVLHCQTGTDCGLCGTGFACKTCPVRFCLTNAFKQKHDLSDVKATMTLYDEANNVVAVDVNLGAELTYIGGEPHMIVSVETLGTPAPADEKA